jgi:hypothetical protein
MHKGDGENQRRGDVEHHGEEAGLEGSGCGLRGLDALWPTVSGAGALAGRRHALGKENKKSERLKKTKTSACVYFI